MKIRPTSLRLHILVPVTIMAIFVVSLLNVVFYHAYTRMILQQEQEVNAVRFEAVSQSVRPLIETNISEVRNIMANDLVASYARHQYASMDEMVHARIDCRDYLRLEMLRHDNIFGLLFMRKDQSLFGALPDANFFRDTAEGNPLPEDMREQILNAPIGSVVWVGPISGAALYGFEDDTTPQSIMIAAWKSVDIRYGECYPMMLMDESVFNRLFSVMQDGNSSWYLFTEDQVEIGYMGDPCQDPERLIQESNSGEIFRDEDGIPVCSFSMAVESPAWTLVRKVSMLRSEQLVSGFRRGIAIFGAVVLLVVLVAYELWQIRFMRQFHSLLKGIVRMGEGDLESTEFEHTTIREFRQMQGEIDRTRRALKDQMETIRQMEREQVEIENERKEQARIAQELALAREIQISALPRVFPPFPDRTEFELYASMTPAKEVGGDFYDLFLVDNDHLALVIADVSGKGVPAALFMMVSKSLIRNELLTGCDPATALQRVNLQISGHNSTAMFVTVWLAVLEISTGRGLACNAGHEHPVIRRAGGDFELLKYPHNLFVSGLKMAKYRNHDVELHPGDCLFVYTDGVPEAQNADGIMFGEERMVDALNQNPDVGPEELIHHVRETVDQFVGDAPQFDDITMLCFKYSG